MTSKSPQSNETPSSETYWEAYSDYQTVSKRVAASVDDALDAYALLDGAHQENAKLSRNRAAQIRQKILSAAMRLLVELEEEKDSKDVYEEILKRWKGGEDNGDGYIRELREHKLQNTMPDFMFQFMLDIRRAAWHLGYLQAGRTSRKELQDRAEEDARSMFSG